ncbi:MAG TPA: amidase [Caldimonas sp.]|nr:amidase [Caldimonas sp.]HEX4233008.1 amidase [Caldimonas sp.]
MTLTDLDADALSRAIHAKDVSCREVMRATLDRIGAVNPGVNAIVSLQDEGDLLRQADARDAMLARGETMGWMHGMPQAIKDAAETKGIPSTLGSPLLKGRVPDYDALMVERMKAAGCIVVGKTNTPEFGLGSHTFNEVFGVTRNAFDRTKSAGGSSGGAAVALATHMLPVADGSDFMGSLRNPAGWNDVYGFRPSQGRVPRWPSADVWVALLSTEGPMGRTVRDVAALLDVQAGWDARVPLSIAARESFAANVDDFDPGDVRIGWLGDLDGYLAMEPGIVELCARALARIEDVGGRVEPIALGVAPERLWQTWLVWRRWSVAARIAPHLEQPANRARIKAEALWEYDQGQGLTGMQTVQACAERTAFHSHMVRLFEHYDALALPSAQVWPFPAEWRWPQQINDRTMDTYHRWMEVVIYATLAGLPSIAIPAGFGANGLPMGVQLIGRPHDDLGVLRLARAFERIGVGPTRSIAAGGAHVAEPA